MSNQGPQSAFSRIRGRLVSYRDENNETRHIDIEVMRPGHPQYPEGEVPSLVLLKRDLALPDQWDDMDGRTLIDGLLVPSETLRLLSANGRDYLQSGPSFNKPRLMNVTCTRMNSGDGEGGRKPQMERVLPGSRSYR